MRREGALGESRREAGRAFEACEGRAIAWRAGGAHAGSGGSHGGSTGECGRASEVAYIPQSHSSTYAYDVLDVVLMSAGGGIGLFSTPKRMHVDRAWDALERVGIAHLGHRPYTQISGGERQLVLIARAIAQNARTIIMDEPTSALDYGNTVRVLSTVRQLAREGMSIVQSTHQPDQAFLYADQTLVINDGRVHAFGNPKDVITKELVSTIYDVDVEVNSLYGDKVRVCVPVREIER